MADETISTPTVSQHEPCADNTAAPSESPRLARVLHRFHMVLFLVCALIGLDTLGSVSKYGAQTFTWVLFVGVVFMIPYGLLVAELGTTFTQEGGPFVWVKLAFGPFWGAMAAFLYWIEIPLWVGGSLCFAATLAWSNNLGSIAPKGVADYAFKLIFIWVAVGSAVIPLRRGRLAPIIGAAIRIGVLTFFSITVVVYAIEHGLHGYTPSSFTPTAAGFIGLVPLLLFSFVGFESENAAGEEMVDPQRDVPRAVLRSGIVAVLGYCIPIFGIVAVLPIHKITGIGGFLDAVSATFGVYGSAQKPLLDIMAIGFIIALLSSGATWLIGASRVQAIAAHDGTFPRWFGAFNRRLGTPTRMVALSGIVATAFMLVAEHYGAGSDATFAVVLDIAISTALLSYLIIFPALVKLRSTHPGVTRPDRVPGGRLGLWAVCGIATAFVALGSWVAVFPDTLEHVFGAGYAFHATWGVSQGRFEALTLGTLAALALIAILGYLFARRSSAT